MTNEQWEILCRINRGEKFEPIPVGFIIDCPWLPSWYGISLLDYFTNDKLWLDANLKAVDEFREILFLPGFWAEYGMCTEPSAFGSKLVWKENNFPHAEKVISDISDIDDLKKPNVMTDGLLPLVINRLKLNQSEIERSGHQIKFAVARGPLNIATFLMGTTEFLMALTINQEECHRLLAIISDYLIDWLEYQLETFKSIDGVFLLDDILGFIGEDDFRQFALPYLKKVFDYFDVEIKFIHNDAPGLITAKFLSELGVNLFSFGIQYSINEIRKVTSNEVTLFGNIPPRDIMAAGSNEDLQNAIKTALQSLDDKRRILFSTAGGLVEGITSEKIRLFLEYSREYSTLTLAHRETGRQKIASYSRGSSPLLNVAKREIK